MTDSKNTPPQRPRQPQGRRKGLTIVAAAVAVAAIAWGGWHWMVARNYQTTDNAYVAGNVVQITPQVGGTVISIGADDTDYVKAGQPLVQLDPPTPWWRWPRPSRSWPRPCARPARCMPTTRRWPPRWPSAKPICCAGRSAGQGRRGAPPPADGHRRRGQGRV
jgi:hypothetical protein